MYAKLVTERKKEIARLAEGKPTEIKTLTSMNVGDYFETTTISYMYMLDLSEKEKEKQEKVEKAKGANLARTKAMKQGKM